MAVALPGLSAGRTDGADAWRRRGLWLGLAWLGLGVVYGPVVADMLRLWTTTTSYNHCFLILPIALFLAWQRRDRLCALAPRASAAGLLPMGAAALLWLAGEVTRVALFQHVAFIASLAAAGWCVLGTAAFRILLFPFAYLLFAVPEGKFLVPYLQDWTAVVVVELLHLTGIPVFIEGRYLAIPSGNFVVAEACSGINYLLASLAVGAMYMDLNFVSAWRRAAFMALATAVPLLANGVRAYGIVMIAHLSDYRYALGVDHFIYGWVFFGLVIFLLFSLGNLFSDLPDMAPPAPAVAADKAGGVPVALIFAALLAVAAAPRLLLTMLDAERPPMAPIALPAVPGWQGPIAAAARLGGRYRGADDLLAARYVDGAGVAVDVEVAYFGTVAGDPTELSHKLFDDERWKQLDYGTTRPAADTGIDVVEWRLLRDGTDGSEVLLWAWSDAGGVLSATRTRVKLGQVRARFAGAALDGARVSVRTVVDEHGREGAEQVLAHFLAGAPLALQRLRAAP